LPGVFAPGSNAILAFDAAAGGEYSPPTFGEENIMFIAHGEKVRKHSRWILGAVLVLLIPGFIALFTQTGKSDRRTGELPTVRGKPVDAVQYEHARDSVIAQFVINSGKQPPRSADFEDRLKQEAVVRMLLLQKAREMGVRVSDMELLQQIRTQPVFVNEAGQFDPERYRRFMIYLNNYGINEAKFEDVMREQSTIAQLQGLIGAAAKVTPGEVVLNFTPLHEKTTIDYVAFDAADYKEPITVTDDEIAKYYEQNKQSYNIPARVKVRYVRFPAADPATVQITDEQVAAFYEQNKAQFLDADKKPKPLDTVKAEIRKELATQITLQDAGQKAWKFAEKLAPAPNGEAAAKPDFAKLAGELGFTPQETDFFSLTDKVPGVNAGREFNQIAFARSAISPVGDPVEGTDGYYVLEYLGNKPSELAPISQVKDKVVDELKKERAFDAIIKLAQAKLAEVKASIAAGKSFSNACTELKLKVKSAGPFTIADQDADPIVAGRVQQMALGLETNTVSELAPSANGALFFTVRERQAPDPKKFDEVKPQLTQQLLQRNRQALFQSWVGSLIREEQVNFGRMRAQPAPQEPTELPTAPAPKS
jgi:peptidyl-prolyl cis-trans isomerase D